MQQKEKTLAKNTLFLYIMQISGYVFPLLTFPYLTRTLGADKYGIIVFVTAAMGYFSLFFEFGFILSATKDCSEFRNDKSKLSEITFSVIFVKIVFVLLGSIVLLFLCLFFEKFSDKKLFLVLFYFGTVLNIFLPDFLFRGIEKMSILTYRVLFSKLVFATIIFAFIKNEEDYIFYPLAVIGGNLVSVILTWISIIKNKYIEFQSIKMKSVFYQLKTSAPFFVSRIAVSFYQNLNVILLGIRFPSNEVGQYGTANTITTICRSLISPISDSIYPYIIKNRNLKLVKKLICILEPIILIGCVVAYFISPFVINLFCGKGYENAIPIFRAMLPLIAISLPTYLFGYPVLGALNKINIANLSVIIGSIFHLIGLFVLYITGYLGFIEISLLTFGTEVVVFGVRVFFCVKYIKKEVNYEKYVS